MRKNQYNNKRPQLKQQSQVTDREFAVCASLWDPADKRIGKVIQKLETRAGQSEESSVISKWQPPRKE